MRKLIYDCYYNNTKVNTVSTFAEAKEWEKQNSNNTIKKRLIEWTDKEETKEEKERRIAMIDKRIKAIREKNKKRNKAAVV